jgi:leucyl/phenylalanyl-tRNA--protein transferase
VEGREGPVPPSVARPTPVPPCRWELDPERADEDGVVGVGADLDVATLVAAYRRGIFPWPHSGMPLLWFSPDPRAVIVTERFHVSRSLSRLLRSSTWTTTVDHDPAGVIAACADRSEGTWITPEMRDAYLELAALGWVRSVEVWDGEELVGGVYGVQIGGVLTGESMFHRRSGASKVALLDLCRRFGDAGGLLVDVQLPTEHLRSLGASDIARTDFLRLLDREGAREVLMRCDRLPASRLAAAEGPVRHTSLTAKVESGRSPTIVRPSSPARGQDRR